MSNLKSLGEKIKPFMPLAGALLGGPLGGAAAAALANKLGAPDSTASTLESFLDKLSPVEKTELDRQYAHEQAMAELKSNTDIALAQIGVNKTAAKHASLFVAGARPALLWVCAFGFAYQFIFRPIVNGIIAWKTGIDANTILPFPAIEIEGLVTLAFGMLGLGAKRTIEKIKGVARNRIKE